MEQNAKSANFQTVSMYFPSFQSIALSASENSANEIDFTHIEYLENIIYVKICSQFRLALITIEFDSIQYKRMCA